MQKTLTRLQNNKLVVRCRPWLKNRVVLFSVLTLPIVLFALQLLLTANKRGAGDIDYLIQTQEAMRRSILEFHQFPWWNPWVSGGVPLFANPQFGLISITTPFTLLFGAIFGYKFSILLYFIIGFWGFRSLFIRAFKTPILTSTLLAYIWTFGSFLTLRASGGHYTFLVIQFLPWALLFYLQRHLNRWSWLKFSLITSLMALIAAHNITVFSYIILGIIFILESFRWLWTKRSRQLSITYTLAYKDFLFWIKAGVLFILLTAYRLYFTVKYLHDYPRLEVNSPEPTVGVLKGLFAMFGPFRQYQHTPSPPQWSWLEVSAYIGFATLLAALLIVYVWIRRRSETKQLFSYSPYVIASIWIITFVLGLGAFVGKLSPYMLLRHLPVLSSMRVASRWFVFSSIFTLVFIAAYKSVQFRTAINILLAISCVELFLYSRPYLAKPYFIPVHTVRSASAPFEEKRLYNTQQYGIPYDENLTEATDNNYGQIIAGDSLVDTRPVAEYKINSKRCAVDDGCNFVQSGNAKVVSWSPNKLELERTGAGMIKLDMNPGACWKVNGVYAFRGEKAAAADKDFLVSDQSSKLTIECRPKYSVEWIFHKVF